MTNQRMHGAFEVHIIRQVDDTLTPEVNAENYEGCSEDEIREYLRQDQDRLNAFNRGEWRYLHLGVELRVKTSANWAVLTTVGRAYLGGVESDSGEAYIEGIIGNLIDEAEHDAWLTFQALQSAFS